MSFTLQVPPELEARLRDRAAERGVDPSELAIRVLKESQELRLPAHEVLSQEETELLRQANTSAAPDQVWDRYRELKQKRDSSGLTDTEFEELAGLSDQLEAAHVRRLEAAGRLSEIWGRPFRDVVTQLGLIPADKFADE